MTSMEAVSVLNGDRVFFTRDSEELSDECTFDCFLKEILNRIRKDDVRVQILVLVPTRELALQITETMQKVAKLMSIKVHACVGGTSVTVDRMVLVNGVHIIVGTPGRVKQMITLKSLGKYSLICII
ncbi:unnamed protein product [Cylicostephanus goldi]|uniref:ATP-dependent RNA helicase n=1 Tax=Cylicostephanus goldi TaxID=71465 RepID=A0A3P6RGU2_CYLGO|nr:unnamed protein product [Cylicostephanus goldi]